MGRVVVEVTLENLEDVWAVRRGSLVADKVRCVVVNDALDMRGHSLIGNPAHGGEHMHERY